MAAQERTFAIIKPDAVANGSTGQIIARIEESGLSIIAMKRMQLSEQLAQGLWVFEQLVGKVARHVHLRVSPQLKDGPECTGNAR